jgi:NAD(P)H-quinone oxidoreductase subunit 5
MLAGLGLYAASLLHLMAHSFYKAHSFLTAGSVIEKVQTNNAAQTVRSGNILKITFALVVGVGIYLILFNIWEHYFETPLKLQLIGGIVLAGVLSLLINALDSNSSYRAIGQVVTQATLTLISFFVLEEIVRYGMASQIPAIGEASPLLIAIASVMVALFLIIIFLPALLPVFNKKTAFKNMSIHFRNGLYINVLFDRLISSLKYKN